MTQVVRDQARDVATLRLMLQSRLASWNNALASWESMGHSPLLMRHAAEVRGRISEIEETLRLMEGL